MTTSVWKLPAQPGDEPVAGHPRVDVCVIGGGAAGVAVAYRLAAERVGVLLLERSSLGAGETLRTTAHLVTALDRGWSALRAIHGDAHARVAAASHAAAIDWIEAMSAAEGIACDFARIPGHLVGSRGEQALDDEIAAARRAGIADVARIAARGVRGADLDGGAIARFPRQARIDPGRWLAGLADAARRRGVRIAPGTSAVAVAEARDHVVVRTTTNATITAGSVVMASNAPLGAAVALSLKQAAYRTYAIAVPVRRGAVADVLRWDMDEPFHYVRLGPRTDDHDLLIVGGEDHKTGQDGDGPSRRFTRLFAWCSQRFPVAAEPIARWSGQVMESIDGLAFIGATSPRVHVVTGDCGNGLTHAVIAGLLLPSLIAGRSHPWAATYDPARVRLRALGTLAEENLNVARQLTDWVAAGARRDVDAILPGSGAVVRRGVSPVAVHRDEAGTLHELSAVCPHLGCIVHWNTAEQSWDCPCHGSRFDARGHVLHGPASRDLAPARPRSAA